MNFLLRAAFAALLLGALGAANASAQVTWLRDSGWFSSRLTRTVSTGSLAAGDVVVLEVRLKAGPKGPPTQLNVWTAQGFRRRGLRPGTRVYRYTSKGSHESVRFQIRGWDRDDFSRVRIGREPRPNLRAYITRPNSQRRMSYGYRVGSRSLRTSRAIYCELYAMRGSKRVALLGRKRVRNRGGSYGSYGYTAPNSMPHGATHFACFVDRGKAIAESDEGDNVVHVAVANPSLSCDYITQKHGAHQVVQYLRVRVTNTTNVAHVYPLRIRVDCAQQNAQKSWVYHRQTALLNRAYTSLAPRQTIEHKLPCPSLPMPKGQSTHVFATVEVASGVEIHAGDNTRVVPISIGPGFRRIAGRRGVGVHEQPHREGSVFVTVVHTDEARIGSYLTSSRKTLGAWWKALVRARQPGEQLAAMFNGTYFAPEAWYAFGVRFPRGLRLSGKVLSMPKDGKTPWQITLHGGRIGIHRYKKPSRIYAGPTPDIIGAQSVLLPAANPRQSWVALRDPVGRGPNGETLHKTALFFTTQRRSMAMSGHSIPVMRGLAETLGCQVGSAKKPANIALIDAGGSRTMHIRQDNGRVRALASASRYRRLPHVIGVFSKN